MTHLTDQAHARTARLPASTVFLLGRLAERRQLQALQARERAIGAYEKLRGRRWKRLRAAMKSAQQGIRQPTTDRSKANGTPAAGAT